MTYETEELELRPPTADGQVSLAEPSLADYRRSSLRYQASVMRRSLGQIGTSFGGFFVACGAAYLTAAVSVWTMLPLTFVAAGFLVRIFIIQHDCGHGSFFRSRRANHAVGWACSLLTLAPYTFWRRQHAGHHASWNNLDRRRAAGMDIYSTCLTVAEYRTLGPWRRFLCRLTHHPFVSNIVFPPLIFLLLYRVPFDSTGGWQRERRQIFITDLALIAWIGGLGLIVGYTRVAEVQLSTMIVASIIGVWLFSIQHRFEHTLWASNTNWSFAAASLRGCSHLHLPRVLQWFTGNIGFHHVHHLNLNIPNYRLEECHKADARLQAAPMLTLSTALGTLGYALWDDDLGRMVRFSEVASQGRGRSLSR